MKKPSKAINDYFDGLEENQFWEGIGSLEKRWAKCVEFRGDYVGKQGTLQNSDCCLTSNQVTYPTILVLLYVMSF